MVSFYFLTKIAFYGSALRLFFQHGFREGISKGQDYILQNAFNDGFEIAAKYFEKLSIYRGRIRFFFFFY